jgi:hypothetical protein
MQTDFFDSPKRKGTKMKMSLSKIADSLAEEAEQIERGGGRESRKRIQEAIEKRYTLPE